MSLDVTLQNLNTTLQQLSELLRTVELAILIVAVALSILLVGMTIICYYSKCKKYSALRIEDMREENSCSKGAYHPA
ncbi:hypothetical protein KIN20_002571 [Parelaphostrongylus tenuis]|uniref:Uncharacterized protein n=1 Tax=Parelaphostrongylus tenuis TaxID=148309 RepID=A0AAD5QHV5_PARTN|nr:hypothetical protein KIN20_002571 [Parelaphostrongylus tenuis]